MVYLIMLVCFQQHLLCNKLSYLYTTYTEEAHLKVAHYHAPIGDAGSALPHMQTLPSRSQAVHCQNPQIPLLNDYHFLLTCFIPMWQVLEGCDKPCGSMLLTSRCHRQTHLEIMQPTGPCSSYDLHQSMQACVPKLLNTYGKEHHHAGKTIQALNSHQK